MLPLKTPLIIVTKLGACVDIKKIANNSYNSTFAYEKLLFVFVYVYWKG